MSRDRNINLLANAQFHRSKVCGCIVTDYRYEDGRRFLQIKMAQVAGEIVAEIEFSGAASRSFTPHIKSMPVRNVRQG